MTCTGKYVGLDVHQATTLASVRAETGRVIARSILPTEAPAVVEFFRGLKDPCLFRHPCVFPYVFLYVFLYVFPSVLPHVLSGVRLGQPPAWPPPRHLADRLEELGWWLVEPLRQCPAGVFPGISPGELPGVFSGVLPGF